MTTLRIGSAICHWKAMISIAEIMTPTDPSRSAITCWKAPLDVEALPRGAVQYPCGDHVYHEAAYADQQDRQADHPRRPL